MAEKRQKMVASGIAIPTEDRKKLAAILNQTLANLTDLKTHAKQVHWNLRGDNFLSYHKFTDKVADEADNAADLVAERCAQIGGFVYGLLSQASKASSLPAFPEENNNQEECMESLLESITYISKYCRANIEAAQDIGDVATSDMYIDITRTFDKLLWMITASIV